VSGRHRATASPQELALRVLQVLLGTAVMGVGVALLVRSQWGLVPLDVLHAGIAARLGWSVGAGIALVQAALLALWLPLRIRPGLGTLSGVVVPAATANTALDLLPTTANLLQRSGFWILGAVCFATGVALYLAADLGANPRDGLMIWMTRHTRFSLAQVRIVLDLLTLVAGLVIVGPATALRLGLVGIGSVVLVALTGPAIQLLLRWLTVTRWQSSPRSIPTPNPASGQGISPKRDEDTKE
jgi:uncharacterized membrane protein YczE